jgi:ABC-type multidrug transport system ATPase subunit/sugar lactone lactonase YvrE
MTADMTDRLWQLTHVTLAGRCRPRLDEVSLDVPHGVTAVIGYSGAGKTSLLNVLVGFERPHKGQILSPPGIQSPHSRLPVFWCPPDGGLWPHLTVREHITAVAPSASPRAEADAWLARFDLARLADSRPDRLSAGEASRLSVARALASDAAVLVMDEPLVHVDPARVGRYWAVIGEHCRTRNASLMFATHSPEDVLREARHVICLDSGRAAFHGPVHALYDAPPTPELAAFLGPANWFSAAEARHWLSCDPGRELCVRPERLTVAPCAEGPLTVRGTRFCGSVAEVELTNGHSTEPRRFYHRPAGNLLREGMRVVLQASLAICLALGLVGCESAAEGRTLEVASVTYRSLPAEGARLPAPRAITFSPRQEMFILDDVGRVLVYDADLNLHRRWWMPEYSVGRPEGIVVMQDGRLAIADTHYHRVVFMDQQGQVLGMFGQEGEEPGQFIFPEDVIQDPHGFLYVCEYGGNDRVQKFTADGQFVLQMGGVGTRPGEFQRTSGLVWHEGKLYVSDTVNNRVQVFADNGKFIAVLADADTAGLQYPYHLAQGPDNALYVVEFQAGRVTRLSLDGEVLGRYGTTGRGQGEFWTPWGIAVDDTGRIIVGDTGNRRLVALSP